MAYHIVHKGVVREFDFYAPFAWTYWHERAFAEDGRMGLPLVVAMHGEGQDQETISDETNWQDRFFVLYPYGFDSSQNDVSFIRAAISAVENMLTIKLAQIGVTRPPIDHDRRFIFGYYSGSPWCAEAGRG